MNFPRAGVGSTSGGGGQMKGIPCKNPHCDQEILCVNNEDLYCSRECYSIKTEREQIEVDTSNVKFKRKGIIARGGTGLLKDPSTLDRLIICADNQYGRIVTVKKGSVGFIQKKAKTKGQPNDPEEILRKQKKKDDKKRLRELLNMDVEDSSDETTSSNEDDLDETETLPVNSLICPPHPPLSSAEGKLLKAYVINVVSPWEIHVKTGKMISKTEEINDICNNVDGIDPRLIEENWSPRVGEFCCAKYEDKMNRAKILEKNGNKFKVVYIDYGNKELVSANELHQLNPEVTLIPAQCIPFKVSNVKPHLNQTGNADWNQEVIKFTITNLEGAVVGLQFDAVEYNEIHVGTLSVVSSLSGLIKGDFGEALVNENMADPDSYYLDQLNNIQL